MGKLYIKGFFYKLGFLLLGFLFLPTFLSCAFFAVNIPINFAIMPLSLIILFILYYFLFYKDNAKKDFYMPIISLCLIVPVLIFIATILEFSWDGWAYHIPAVIKLENGYNPIYQHAEDYNIWSVHYPKFMWIYGANLYKITGSIFAGTSFNSIMILILFCFSYDIFKKIINKKILPVLFALIVAFNLVAIVEIFAYYNDGTLGNCIWGLLLIFYAISKDYYKFDSKNILIITFFSSILANIKFTGALFAFGIVGVFLLYLLIIKKIRFNKKIILPLFCIGIGVGLVALTTYLPNYLHHKNIAYPLYGENKIDIITDLTPTMLKNDNKYLAFLKSVSYDSSYEFYKYRPFYKISLIDIKWAVEGYGNGFGPFFQTILIVFVTLLLYLIVHRIISKKKFCFWNKNMFADYILLFLLLIMIIVTPGIWWGRYIPYFYSLPLIMIVLYKKEWNIKKIDSILVYMIAAVYVGSLATFGIAKVSLHAKNTNDFYAEIEKLKKYSQQMTLNLSDTDVNQWYKYITREELLKNNNISYIMLPIYQCNVIENFNMLGVSLVDCEENKNG